MRSNKPLERPGMNPHLTSHRSAPAAQRRAVRPLSAGGMLPRANMLNVMADRRRGGQLMNLDAKPEAITFDTTRTAVLGVDMQNDFGSKGGMFDRAGIDISGIQKAVDPTAKVLVAARRAGVK